MIKNNNFTFFTICIFLEKEELQKKCAHVKIKLYYSLRSYLIIFEVLL